MSFECLDKKQKLKVDVRFHLCPDSLSITAIGTLSGVRLRGVQKARTPYLLSDFGKTLSSFIRNRIIKKAAS